jgi:protein-disulfide isomerase
MLRIYRLAHLFPARRTRLRPIITAALLLVAAAGAQAQFGAPPPGTHVLDTSALHPPPGARVAIIEFMDLECPVCASSNPILVAAAAQYKIPLVRHDFLIPYHAWSPIAAADAQWFDTKSKALGEEYRAQVFANQPTFYNNPELLRQFTEKFAQSHGIVLPFAIDPQGKFAAEVKADSDLGRRTGIDHTPTVFIVTSGGKGPPFVEVKDLHTDLYQDIDQALRATAGPASKVQVKKTASH